MRLSDILVKRKLISVSDLEQITRQRILENRPLCQFLIESKLVERTDLDAALQEQYWRNRGFWIID